MSAGGVLRESWRRARAAVALRRERARVGRAGTATEARRPRLRAEFAALSDEELLAHFRAGGGARFLPGFEAEEIGEAARARLPRETEELLARARRIVGANAWPLLGCGELEFGEKVDWLRDPRTGARWPPVFHADVEVMRGDGSDVRVLWELNRLGHLVTLAQAYAVTRDESFGEKFFADVEAWRAQNPVGRGPNWIAAMEAALRASNLAAAFRVFRRSDALDARRLKLLLTVFDEHGRFVRAHLEYSHLATGNHYLADVAGLVWLGLLLPELSAARGWRDFGLRELLRELEKQVLPDGAHYESSTGYHRFAAELFLYTFLLCRENGVEIKDESWARLRAMLEYARAYLRPDGRAPLVGDADGGRVLALAPRAADDHAYLLAVGAAAFGDARFRAEDAPPAELFWTLGPRGLDAYARLTRGGEPSRTRVDDESQAREVVSSRTPEVESAAFAHAGNYVMRAGDLYLLLSAAGAGLRGRGSHAHNDALSLEVSACGASFIADPGTFVYTADLAARHLFRSTAAHSTVEVDGAEQNTTDERRPFRIGDEARPRLLGWHADARRDFVSAEHRGYARLPAPVTHRRSVTFDKPARLWLVEDELIGGGDPFDRSVPAGGRSEPAGDGRAGAAEHDFRFRFHAAPGVEARVRGAGAELYHAATGARLLVVPVAGLAAPPAVEPRWSSRDYCQRAESHSLCWHVRAPTPLRAAFALVALRPGEDEAERLQLLAISC